MNNRISPIKNDVQNRESEAWKKLCEYVDQVASEGLEEFSPFEALGDELFSQIYTLPESISKLTKVKKMWLYGSKLTLIPPEIGKMESLESFDPYTSYNLHWFPYELTECKNLKDSRVSTRALYGNYKTKKGFPRLTHSPVRYHGEKLECSICKKEITYDETSQWWVSIWVGTDVLPLLVNVCSDECRARIPDGAEGYLKFPHQGGANLKQTSEEESRKAHFVEIKPEDLKKNNQKGEKKAINPLKLIRKIWEKD